MKLEPSMIAALAACICFGLHYTALRAASGKIGDALGGLLLELAAAAGLLVLLVVSPASETATTTRGVVWAVLSGLCITGGVTFLFMSLRLGGPVASTGTIALGGGVALAALASPFLFGETFTLRRAAGVALGVGAMILLATEPAER
jgi:drug/metabolite transporter (DMT)-like permease